MLIPYYEPEFLRRIAKIKDSAVKERVKKQVKKICANPEIGKPMMHERKGTREVYLSPHRISYMYIKNEERIVFLEIYHKDEQ